MGCSFSLLVLSCDNYSDLWPTFGQCFQKNWPDLDVDKYFVTNHIEDCSIPGFTTLPVGKDISWSDNLNKALSNLKTDYVFIMLEDFFLSAPVNTPAFMKYANMSMRNNWNYLKFLPEPKGVAVSGIDDITEIPVGWPYRSTAVFALWKKETLQKILVANESAWQFERNSSIRTEDIPNFYTLKNYFFPVRHGVIRGKFLKSTVEWLKKSGITYNQNRDTNSHFMELKMHVLLLRKKLFNLLIPGTKRNKVRKWFKGN